MHLHCAGESESDDEGVPPSYKPDKSRRRSPLKQTSATAEDSSASPGSTSTALPLLDARTPEMEQSTPETISNSADDVTSSRRMEVSEHNTAPSAQQQTGPIRTSSIPDSTGQTAAAQDPSFSLSDQATAGDAPKDIKDKASSSHPSALLEKASPEAGMPWHHHQTVSPSSSTIASQSTGIISSATHGTQQVRLSNETAYGLQASSVAVGVDGGHSEGNMGQGWGQYGAGQDEAGQGQNAGQGLGGSLAFQQELQQRASRREAARAGGLRSEASTSDGDTNASQAVR